MECKKVMEESKRIVTAGKNLTEGVADKDAKLITWK